MVIRVGCCGRVVCAIIGVVEKRQVVSRGKGPRDLKPQAG